jgi:hypothetical protein
MEYIMATTSEINDFADIMADKTTAARNSIPTSWYPMDKLPLVTEHMKKAEAEALEIIFAAPWKGVRAYNTSNPEDDEATLGQRWFNKGGGWAVAATQRNALTRWVRLEGVVYPTTLNTTDPIIEFGDDISPINHQLIPALAGVYGNMVMVPLWLDASAKSLKVWDMTLAPTIDHLSLSGIAFRTAD